MNRILLIVLILISTSAVLSQTVDDRRQELQKQISSGLIENRMADVVKAGTELVEIEKGLGEANIANYALALTNLALWKERFTGTTSSDLSANVRWARNSVSGLDPKAFEDLIRLKSEIISHFEEVVGLYRSKLNDPIQLSSILLEYGDFRCRESNEYDDMQTVPALLREALEIRDRNNPADSEPVINALLRLSECEFNTGNFAEYYEANKRLLASIEKRFGPESKRLLRPLITFERFLILTDRTIEAGDVLKRVSTITGGTYTNSTPDDIVVLRMVGRIDVSVGNKSSTTVETRSGISVPNPANATRNDRSTVTWDQRGNMSVVTIPGSRTTATNIPVQQGITTIRSRGFTQIPVSIVVDATGTVVEATANITNKSMKKAVERKVKDWKFRPLVIDGVGQKMLGTVVVDYRF